MGQPQEVKKPSPVSLTRKESFNIFFLVLAFSCVVACLTMIIGTAALVVKSVGGSDALSSAPLGLLFLGMSLISLSSTHWIFRLWGRKIGFWYGIVVALIGIALACVGCSKSSIPLVLSAYLFVGAGLGMGMYLRFAALEVVPTEFSAKAVSWVLAGGCIAAFAGPEAAQATKGMFGSGNMEYMGVFVTAGCFYVAQAIFVGLVRFPREQAGKSTTNRLPRMETIPEVSSDVNEVSTDEDDASNDRKETAPKSFCSLLNQPDFIFPLLVAIFSWAIMVMPMSIFRLVMKELGFTERQSLLVIEFHFLSMYSPGFISGKFIKQHGPIVASCVTLVCYFIGLGVNLAAPSHNNTTATWYTGLIILGMGWNFGYSASTVWIAKAYEAAPHLKAQIQAANECGMFFFSGGLIFSAGYIYGGKELPGWRLLNYVLLGLTCVLTVIVLTAMWFQKRDTLLNINKSEMSIKKGSISIHSEC